jgi:hypothetical protein
VVGAESVLPEGRAVRNERPGGERSGDGYRGSILSRLSRACGEDVTRAEAVHTTTMDSGKMGQHVPRGEVEGPEDAKSAT